MLFTWLLGGFKVIIRTLAENTTLDSSLGCQHGLSLLVETDGRSILFDMGADGLFAENASKMGVDLAAVDAAFVSHGHSDHGGGLKVFLQMNDRAKVYINGRAFEPHFARRGGGTKAFIGLDSSLLEEGRVITVQGSVRIDDSIEIMAESGGCSFRPSGNCDLLMERGGQLVEDDFGHEQNLVVKEGGKSVLLAGCAHNGIVNIMEKFRRTYGRFPDYVIGGFHMYNKTAGISEDPGFVEAVASYLLDTKAAFFTCHCTGLEAYDLLKVIMGDRIGYLATGSTLSI